MKEKNDRGEIGFVEKIRTAKQVVSEAVESVERKR